MSSRVAPPPSAASGYISQIYDPHSVEQIKGLIATYRHAFPRLYITVRGLFVGDAIDYPRYLALDNRGEDQPAWWLVKINPRWARIRHGVHADAAAAAVDLVKGKDVVITVWRSKADADDWELPRRAKDYDAHYDAHRHATQSDTRRRSGAWVCTEAGEVFA